MHEQRTGPAAGGPAPRRSRRALLAGLAAAAAAVAVAVTLAGMHGAGSATALASADVRDVAAATVTASAPDLSWEPGAATYQTDASGCHVIQQDQLAVPTPAIAASVTTALQQQADTAKDLYANGVKTVGLEDAQQQGNVITLQADGWLVNDDCAAADTALVTGPVRPGTARTLALTRTDQASGWFTQVGLGLLAAAAYAAIIVVVSVVVVVDTIAAGAGLATILATAATAGCIAGAATQLIINRWSDPTASTEDRIAVATRGCITGAVGLPLAMGAGIAPNVRRNLATSEEILGQSGVDDENQSGIEATKLGPLFDGVAEGAQEAG